MISQFLSDLYPGFLWVVTRLPVYYSMRTSGVDTTRPLSTFYYKVWVLMRQCFVSCFGRVMHLFVPGEPNTRGLHVGYPVAEPRILGELEDKVWLTQQLSPKRHNRQFLAPVLQNKKQKKQLSGGFLVSMCVPWDCNSGLHCTK